MVLEPAVGGRTHAIVAFVERLEHHVGNARVVETREHDQRLEADVGVGVAVDGFDQRRHRHGRVGAAHRPGGVHADREVHRPEQIDRRLELRGSDLLRGGGGRTGGRLGGEARSVEQPRQRSNNDAAPRQDHRRLVDRLEGELEIRLLVLRERHRIDAGVAGRAVGVPAIANRLPQAVQAQIRERVGFEEIANLRDRVRGRRSDPSGSAYRRRRSRAKSSAGN